MKLDLYRNEKKRCRNPPLSIIMTYITWFLNKTYLNQYNGYTAGISVHVRQHSSLGTLLSRGEAACSSLFGKCAFNFILQLDIPVSLQIILLVMASEAKAPASHYCDPGSIPSDVTLQCSWTLSRTPIFFYTATFFFFPRCDQRICCYNLL